MPTKGANEATDRALAAAIWVVVGLFAGLAIGIFVNALPVGVLIGLVGGLLLAWYKDRRSAKPE